jgi:cytochrome c
MMHALAVGAAAFLALGAAHAEDAPALLTKYRCYVCHGDDEAKAGPAFADVAARDRGDPKAPSRLAALIRKGAHGGGPWHMPPHPEVSAAEARTMSRYILSLKN